MVGDVGVGKSSITARYVLNKFDTKMESTLGAAYM
jgi:GTPase SAR1 family protein